MARDTHRGILQVRQRVRLVPDGHPRSSGTDDDNSHEVGSGSKGRIEIAEYLRDGRAPVPESEVTSRVMSANRGKDTGPEMVLRKALRENGMSGYRVHWTKAPGRPDICYPGRRLAIFVHGCYWHRCPRCDLPLPRSNTDFWRAKFERNRERDARKVKDLEEAGWRVLTVWECEIRDDPINVVKMIQESHGL